MTPQNYKYFPKTILLSTLVVLGGLWFLTPLSTIF